MVTSSAKSFHFKKTDAQSSFLLKVLPFLQTLFWFQQKWQQFWKKWELCNCENELLSCWLTFSIFVCIDSWALIPGILFVINWQMNIAKNLKEGLKKTFSNSNAACLLHNSWKMLNVISSKMTFLFVFKESLSQSKQFD